MRREEAIVRQRIVFRGIVQGVGFRPNIYRCAAACGLHGFVRNMRSHVTAEIQGAEASISLFRRLLPGYLPPAARVDEISWEDMPLAEESGFRIEESAPSNFTLPPIPPDLAICEECRREMLDPGNRRYLYPFIACTQCGPRYTITADTPFDRKTTSMADFRQCPDCLAEYGDPHDRRFHFQANSCARCGPSLFLSKGERVVEPAPADPPLPAGILLPAVIDALTSGKIVAIQGIGGFHLAADPRAPGAVERLRVEKLRRTKPFALMVRDAAAAQELCVVSPEELRLLLSPLSPILILPKRKGIPTCYDSVSDTDTLGIMLPYTPLHVLLFFFLGGNGDYKSLVMTSGNCKSEPIISDPTEARERLSDIADFFLFTDRRIVFKTDDSVLRTVGGMGAPVLMRRSRGFVPSCLEIKYPVTRPTLALGGDLKNAPALAMGRSVSLLPYMGDCEDLMVQRHFEAGINETLRLFKVKPERIVSDLHPLYFTTQRALLFDASYKIGVQHHWAHMLSVMAEYGLTEAVGAVFDGTGYGVDGASWGGEFLWARRDAFKRLGTFRPFPLPGGDSAVLHPKRIAFSMLYKTESLEYLARLLGLKESHAELLADMLEKNVNAPQTTAAGRILDAVSALLGIVDDIYYEGEGPIKLESEASRWAQDNGINTSVGNGAKDLDSLMPLLPPAPPLKNQGVKYMIDYTPLFLRLMDSLDGENRGALAFLVHEVLASAVVRGLKALAADTGIRNAVLSGGVFQNVLLRRLTVPALMREGFTVYVNEKVPCNDGGLALGQVYCSLE